MGQSTDDFDSNEHADGGFIANRNTKLKRTRMMINNMPVNIQMSKDDVPNPVEKNDLLRRMGSLEEQNSKIQDQLDKIVRILTESSNCSINSQELI